jgi:hypothetical protein
VRAGGAAGPAEARPPSSPCPRESAPLSALSVPFSDGFRLHRQEQGVHSIIGLLRGGPGRDHARPVFFPFFATLKHQKVWRAAADARARGGGGARVQKQAKHAHGGPVGTARAVKQPNEPALKTLMLSRVVVDPTQHRRPTTPSTRMPGLPPPPRLARVLRCDATTASSQTREEERKKNQSDDHRPQSRGLRWISLVNDCKSQASRRGRPRLQSMPPTREARNQYLLSFLSSLKRKEKIPSVPKSLAPFSRRPSISPRQCHTYIIPSLNPSPAAQRPFSPKPHTSPTWYRFCPPRPLFFLLSSSPPLLPHCKWPLLPFCRAAADI